MLMSVNIQREIGGSLANLFQTVSDTVRQRQQFRRRVHALTSMGRASAYVLVALPFVTAAHSRWSTARISHRCSKPQSAGSSWPSCSC